MSKVVSIIVISIIIALSVTSAAADVYPKTAVVVELNYEDDIVVVDDGFFLWEFFGCEDYELGDIVSMLMDDTGTEYILDDVVISAIFSGFNVHYMSFAEDTID